VRPSATIGIVGTGGDGVIVLGSLLQRLAAAQGYFGQMSRYYGAQIRGGGSAVKLGLDAQRLSMPGDTLDILVSFSWDKYGEFDHELALTKASLVLYAGAPPEGIDLPPTSHPVDFTKAAKSATGSALDKNMVALGLLTRLLPLSADGVRDAIAKDKELHLLREKAQAVEEGERLAGALSAAGLDLAPAEDVTGRMVLHGNKAVALGAQRAGCNAFFGYPITPAAEIMQEMQRALSGDHNCYLQAEDEIATAGMIIGASLSGAKAMSATSGPGLDLMTETIGLASAAEVPMVIVDVQRCGPSTGIPSKSEQSDLYHAVYGGHGEAPRVVLAPHHVAACYSLTIEAFNIACAYQTPVVLLSDQWLGQTLVALDDDFIRRDYPIEAVKRPTRGDAGSYRRYAQTTDHVSPMSVAGDEGLTYRTTGLTHNDRGAPAFDADTSETLHYKRSAKLDPLRERDDLVTVTGAEESDIGIISWGSSASFVMETVRELDLDVRVRLCVPQLLHPLPGKVEEFAASVSRLLIVEMNYSGQFHRYLRSLIDLPRDTRVYSRPGGRPFTRAELARPIERLVS